VRPHPVAPIREGSGATMCPVALDPPPCTGGLQCRHTSCGSRPRLPAQEGSRATMHPTASDPPPRLGGFQHRHVSRNYLWGMNKEVFDYNG
jgi:hypothetical protein